MTDFLLALAFAMTLMCGYWIVSRLDGYLDSVNDENDDADAHHTLS